MNMLDETDRVGKKICFKNLVIEIDFSTFNRRTTTIDFLKKTMKLLTRLFWWYIDLHKILSFTYNNTHHWIFSENMIQLI